MKKLALLAALAIVMSCDSSTRVAGPKPLSNADAAASALTASAQTFYGPERFTRTRGAPDAFERTIATSGFDAPYVLHVRNGTADGQSRVSSARVLVNGKELLGTTAFSQQVAGYDLPVDLGATNALHVEVAGSPGAYLDISVEGIPSGNLRVCPGVTAPRTYATLEQALAVAQDGNTIWFCDGTHPVNGDVTLGDKSLTLIAEHPLQATIDGLDAGQTLTIGSANATSAAIDIRGLVFTNAHNFNIAVQQNYGTVRITGSEFHPRLAKGDPFDAAGVRVLGATGNGITIENDAFIGGDAGVAAGGGAGVRVLNSRFVEQWDVAIQGGNGEGIYAEANDIKGCGPNWCIAVFGGKGSTQLLRNTITIDATRPVVNVIQVHDGDYEISGNTIVGTGGTRAKDDPKTWPIQSNAITVSTTGADGVATANITNNVVKGAFNGLGFNHTSSGTVTDNVVSDVGSPINFYYSTVAAHRNDFSGYITPFQFVSESSGSSATCNWWGSAYGPDAPPFIDALLYTPWSAQPIAGTTVACDPTPALPQVVRVCSVTDGSQTLHALTIARAVALVATGGKIELCDGTHVASVVWLSRDVTIEAEHPLAAIVDGAGQASLNTQFDATAAIALRGLVFTNNGTSNSVNAQNFRGSLVVDGSAFRLVASYPYNTSREGYQDHYTNGGIGIFDSPGSVTVRNSTFNGGDIGIHANNANLLVQQSHFSGQSNAGTFSGFAATVRVENSSYDNCGRMGCAKMFSSTGGRGEFVADTFTVTADHPVWTPLVIGLNAGSAVLEGNVITGVGGDGDRTQQSTYPIDGFAMQLAAGGGVVLNRNHITNAYTAMNYTPASGGGSDNVVSHVYNFLTGGGAPSGASANLTRNDITDYVVGVTNSGIFSTLNLRCNWWGTNAGPTNIGGGVLQASYTPWADQEIAGHPELPCTESYTIAFSDGLVDGNSMPRRLFVQQTDGTNPQVLAQYASDELGLTPAWSHDGSQIVFQVGVPQWGDLYLMDARPGATPVDITPPLGDGVDVGAAFAPDGRILYTSTRTGNYELWVRNTDGTQTQLTHTAAAEGGSAAFSPDGSQIAFARSSASGGYEIWVMNSQPNADGTYTEHQVTNIGGTCGFPRWTPDGRLLFGGGPSDLFLYFVNANASMATMDQLTAVSTGGIEATMSDISSDGRKIIFDAFRVSALYVMNADGSGLTKVPLPTGVTANYPRFKPVP